MSIKNRLLGLGLGLGLGLSFTAGTAFAHGATEAPATPARRFREYDANRDQKLSYAEIRNRDVQRNMAEFNRADRNGDNVLSYYEQQTTSSDFCGGAHGTPASWNGRGGHHHGGVLTRDQAKQQSFAESHRLFRAADLNGDGSINRAELQWTLNHPEQIEQPAPIDRTSRLHVRRLETQRGPRLLVRRGS